MKISIITVAFNAAETIESTLRSVAQQTFRDVEHILIDGCSTDGTMDVVGKHMNSLAHVIHEPDDGIYHAMNKGLRLATGDIVGILNADDYYPSDDVLAKITEVFSDPAVDACYGDLKCVDSMDTGKIVRFWRSGDYNPRKFYWGWMPPHPTFFVRRSFYEEYGLFNLEFGTAADYEIMLRFLLKHKLKTIYIQQVLVHMRTGGVSNARVINRLRANRMARKAWTVNQLRPYSWTIWAKPVRKFGQWFFK